MGSENKSETVRMVVEIETDGPQNTDEIRDTMVQDLLAEKCRSVRVLAEVKSIADEPAMHDLSNLMVLYLMVLMPDFGTDPRQNSFAASLVGGLLGTVLAYPLVNVENGSGIVNDILENVRSTAGTLAQGYQERTTLEEFEPQGSAN